MSEQKTTCPSCNKTGNYEVKPNYCAFCGKKISNNNDHKKQFRYRNKDNS